MSIRAASPIDNSALNVLLKHARWSTKLFRAATEMVHPDKALIVYEAAGILLAVMELQFVRKSAFESSKTILNHFLIDHAYRNAGLGEQMETYAVRWAMERGCNRVVMHYHDQHDFVHELARRCGYHALPTHYAKELSYDFAYSFRIGHSQSSSS